MKSHDIPGVLTPHPDAQPLMPQRTAAGTWISTTGTETRYKPQTRYSERWKAARQRADVKWRSQHPDKVLAQRRRWYHRRRDHAYLVELGFTIARCIPQLQALGRVEESYKRSRRQDLIDAVQYQDDVQGRVCGVCSAETRLMIPALCTNGLLWRIVCEDCARFVDTGMRHKSHEIPRIGTIATRLNDEAQE